MAEAKKKKIAKEYFKKGAYSAAGQAKVKKKSCGIGYPYLVLAALTWTNIRFHRPLATHQTRSVSTSRDRKKKKSRSRFLSARGNGQPKDGTASTAQVSSHPCKSLRR